MSALSSALKTSWDLYQGDATIDGLVKDWVVDKWDQKSGSVSRMPDELRNQHLLCVGRSGCGKSSFLYGLMAQEIPKALNGDLTLIYVDPVTGVDKVIEETGVDKYRNVFLIDLADPDSLPRLSLFETGRDRGDILGTTHMINTFKEVCAGLLDQEMTSNMGTLFGYCARVMMRVENRTLHDLMDLLQSPLDYIQALDFDPGDPVYKFFDEDVVGRKGARGSFTDTVKYVRNRVHGFLNDPIIERLFINRYPTMSLSKVIEAGSIILVATRKSDVGQDGCRLVGKFIKTVVNRVMQERGTAGKDGVPVRYYEDEFQNSLSGGKDALLARMLDENRKFGLSINLATTRFGHIGTEMGDAVMTCTAIKVCGTMPSKGAAVIASELGRTVQEITELPNYRLFVKAGSRHKKAIEVSTPKDPFKKLAKNDSRAIYRLRSSMDARFGTRYLKKKPAIEAQTVEAIEDVEM